ncbi:MAG TPA: rRNA maturation RNase YbeY [Planctomycetia bacterium]|nr:rRNA maturation RNase YbeY [Planctomycetia bacterium]
MISVSIADNQSSMPVDRGWFRDLVRFVCEREGIDQAKIGLAFLDDAEIHRLNRRFLDHDYPTDVLTFPMATGKKLEAEIALSTEYAAREAVTYDWPAHVEASLYVVHGVLHLAGYDDGDEKEKTRMEARQQELLAEFRAGRAEAPYREVPAFAPEAS